MAKNTFGTLVHNTLENLLTNQPPLNEQAWLKLSKNTQAVEKEVELVIRKDLKADDKRGGNMVLKKVAIRLIQRFFQMQAEECQSEWQGAATHIIALEKDLKHSLEFEIDGKPITLRLYGQADRIDYIGHTLRVVDYKTGNYHKSDLKASNSQELLEESAKGKVIQLMVYKYLLLKALEKGELEGLPSSFIENPGSIQIQAGFYFLTKIDSGFIQHEIEDAPESRTAYLTYVEGFLKSWITKLLDQNEAFVLAE